MSGTDVGGAKPPTPGGIESKADGTEKQPFKPAAPATHQGPPRKVIPTVPKTVPNTPMVLIVALDPENQFYHCEFHGDMWNGSWVGRLRSIIAKGYARHIDARRKADNAAREKVEKTKEPTTDGS